MKVAIIGSRTIQHISPSIWDAYIPKECTKIITGGAVGVDHLAEEFARTHNIPLQVFLPDYKLFGKQAPLVRNTQIVEASDYLVAFWDNKSRGTAFVIKECLRLNKQFVLVNNLQE